MKTFSLNKKMKFFFVSSASLIFSTLPRSSGWGSAEDYGKKGEPEAKKAEEQSWKLAKKNSRENKKNYLAGMFETRRWAN